MAAWLKMLSEEEFDTHLRHNPVNALCEVKRDLEANEESHTENICRCIQRAKRIHSKIEKNDRLMAKFYELNFWSRRTYKPNRNNLLLHCMQYLVGAIDSSSSSYNTAHDYKTAVEILSNKGVPCTEIYDELVRAGGPYALLDTNKDFFIGQNWPAKRQSLGDGEGNDRVGEDLPQEASSPNQLVPTETSNRQPNSENTEADRGRVNIVRLFEKKKHIALTVCDYMDHFFSMGEGERIWLLVERVEDEGRFSRYEVMRVDSSDD